MSIGLMRHTGIMAIMARQRRARLTVAPPLLERSAATPNRSWFADVTHLETDQGAALLLIRPPSWIWFSRKIVDRRVRVRRWLRLVRCCGRLTALKRGERALRGSLRYRARTFPPYEAWLPRGHLKAGPPPGTTAAG